MKYRILYDSKKGVHSYTVQTMSKEKAIEVMQSFFRRYLNDDGSPKTYPNGKGVYDISNPRIVQV